MNIKKPITAHEFIQQLESDPEYLRRIAEKERARQAAVEAYKANVAPIIEDLRKAGQEVGTLGDLYGTKASSGTAPILIAHLATPTLPDDVRWSILSVLTDKQYRPVCRDLVALFTRDYHNLWEQLQFAFIDAIATLVSKDSLDSVLPIVRDPQFGGVRRFLVPALAKIDDPAVTAVFDELMSDPDLQAEVKKALTKRKAKMAKTEKARTKPVVTAAVIESSVYVDREDLAKVLEAVARCVSAGFTKTDIEEWESIVDSLEIDEDDSLTYDVMCDSLTSQMVVTVLKEDVDAVSIYVFVPEPLSSRIDDQLTLVLSEF